MTPKRLQQIRDQVELPHPLGNYPSLYVTTVNDLLAHISETEAALAAVTAERDRLRAELETAQRKAAEFQRDHDLLVLHGLSSLKRQSVPRSVADALAAALEAAGTVRTDQPDWIRSAEAALAEYRKATQ